MQKATPNTGTGNGAAGLIDSFNFWNVNVPIANLSPQTAEVGLLIDKPVASFSTNVTHGINPTGVAFTDSSSNAPSTWNWTFNNVLGNNTNISFSTSQNPAYNFPAGNYSIYLNASNAYGYNVSSPTWINVTEKLLSTFTGTPTTGIQPMTVTYNATVNVAPFWFNGSYGDGTYYNQTTFPGTNLTHYYSTGGNFTNTWSTYYGENQVNTSTFYVQVYNTTTASFTYGNATTPYGQVAPAVYQFTDTSINATLPTPTYYWMFGDGQTSTSASPVHIYAAAGTTARATGNLQIGAI
jgi:PKD repeat protein